MNIHTEKPQSLSCVVGAVALAPVALGAIGFTAGGIAAGSYAAGMMSAAAAANGGGVAAGGLVAVLQSAGNITTGQTGLQGVNEGSASELMSDLDRAKCRHFDRTVKAP